MGFLFIYSAPAHAIKGEEGVIPLVSPSVPRLMTLLGISSKRHAELIGPECRVAVKHLVLTTYRMIYNYKCSAH